MKIRTVRDARIEKILSDERRFISAERRELLAKVRKWERKVALYGGDVHIETLARLRAKLEYLY